MSRFISILLLATVSFSLLVQGVCHSPNSTGTLTAMSGMLLSDVDGGGPYRVTPYQTCQWQIQCPSDHYVGVYKFTGREYAKMIKYLDGTKTQYVPQGSFDLPLMSHGNTFNIELSIGDAYSTDWGFTLRWLCVPTRCSSVNATAGNISMFNGTSNTQMVISETDGYENAQLYLLYETCHMTFNCPASLPYLAFSQLRGTMYSGHFYLYNTGQLWEAEKAVYPNSVSWDSDLLAKSPVSLSFATGNTLKVGAGWSVFYRCIVGMCSSVNVSGSTYTQNSGTIVTSMDGVNGNQLRGETCTYLIQCPTTTDKLVFHIDGTYNTSRLLQFLDPSTAEDLFNFTRSYGLLFLGTHAVRLNLTSFRYLPNSTDEYPMMKGLTITWECRVPQQAQCSSVNLTLSTFTAGEGTIMSDTDGYGSNVYALNDNCTWWIHCPNPDDNIIMFQQVNTPSVNSSVHLFNGSNNDQQEIASLSGNMKGAAIYKVSKMKIHFQPDPAYSLNGGFTLKYECAKRTCSSPTSGSVRIAPHGTIMTDQDGEGEMGYASNENCSWTVRCPKPSDTIWMNKLTGKTLSGDILRITTSAEALNDTNNLPITAMGTFNDDRGAWFNTSELRVTFATDSSNFDVGFKLWYSCAPAGQPKCSSWNATMQNLTGPLLVQNGTATLVTDVDGGLPIIFAKNEWCDWTITCPHGSMVSVVHLSGRTSTTSQRMSFYDADTNQELFLAYGSNRNILGGFFTPKMRVTWKSSSEITPAPGFTVTYTCVVGRCASPNQTGSVYSNFQDGLILTDIDGESQNFKAAAGSFCTWVIQCSLGQGVEFTYFYGRMSIYDIFEVTNGTGGPRLFATGGSMSEVQQLFFDTPTINITLTASTRTSSDRYGYTIQYRCATGFCSSQDTPQGAVLTEPSGEINSDKDGSSADTKYKKGERCFWYIQCPSSYSHVVVFQRGDITFSDYLKIGYNGTALSNAWMSSDMWRSAVYNTSAGAIAIQFGAGNKNTDFGFTIKYKCLNTQCPSETPGGVDNVAYVPINGTGLIYSPAAILEETNYQSPGGSMCLWQLHCAGAGLDVTYQGDLSYSGPLLFFNHTFDKDPQDTDMTAPELKLPVESTTIKVFHFFFSNSLNFTSVVYKSIPWYYGEERFTLHYKCVAKLCNASVPSGSVLAGSSTFGEITEGTSYQRRYSYGEECQWTITCPPGNMARVQVTGNIWSEDYVQVIAPGNKSVIANWTGSLSSTTNYVILPSSLIVTFRSVVGTGFGTASYFNGYYTILYNCFSGPPTITPAAATDAQTPSVSRSVLATDVQTMTASLSIPTQPANTSSIPTQMVTGSGTPTDTSAPTGTQTPPAFCSSKSNPNGETLTESSGEINSDEDGSGAGAKYKKNESCAWYIQCPSMYSYVAILVKGYFGNPATGFLSLGHDGSSNMPLHMSTGWKSNIYNTSLGALKVHFTTSSSVNSGSYGFTLRYQCITTQCPNATSNGVTTLPSNGTGNIVSPAVNTGGSSATSPIPGGAMCLWQVHCEGATNAGLSVDFTGNMDNSGPIRLFNHTFTEVPQASEITDPQATLKVATSLTHSLSFFFRNPTTYTSFVFASASWYSRGDDFTLYYKCVSIQSLCNASRKSGSVINASTYPTITNGIKKKKTYSVGEFCKWTFFCPNGKLLKVTVAGETNTQDVVTIYSPGTSNILKQWIGIASTKTETLPGNSADVTFQGTIAFSWKIYYYAFYPSCIEAPSTQAATTASPTTAACSLNCGPNGKCVSGNVTTGTADHCVCKHDSSHGYWRARSKLGYCADCEFDYYGTSCEDSCPRSTGNTVCGGHGICDSGVTGTGNCLCFPPWIGNLCTAKCPTGPEGYTCGYAPNAGSCNANGVCQCATGFMYSLITLLCDNPPSLTLAPVSTKPVVLAAELNYTKTNFDDAQQANFKETISQIGGITPEEVTITSVKESTKVPGTIEVEFVILTTPAATTGSNSATPTVSNAAAISNVLQTLSGTGKESQLLHEKLGMLGAPTVSADTNTLPPTDQGTNDLPLYLGIGGGVLGLFILIGIAIVCHKGGKGSDLESHAPMLNRPEEMQPFQSNLI